MMPRDQDYLGYDLEPQEGYMQPDKYRVRLRCLRCNHEYTRVVKSLNDPDPPCPKKKCIAAAIEEEIARRTHNAREVLEARSFPGVTGDKPIVAAIDKTADRVMSDYGLTDLRTDIRSGESMVPKLPVPMQAAADNFFGGGVKAVQSKAHAKRMDLLGKRAMAGAFRAGAVAPADVFPGSRGESALRHVRTEKN